LEKIKVHLKHDKTKYFFLQRLRFWALSLARVHIDKKGFKYEELLASKKSFDDWFSDFWRDIFRDLVQAFNAAQEAKISVFALARNETRWKSAKNTVESSCNHGINGGVECHFSRHKLAHALREISPLDALKKLPGVLIRATCRLGDCLARQRLCGVGIVMTVKDSQKSIVH
jgi:hypothetical protein